MKIRIPFQVSGFSSGSLGVGDFIKTVTSSLGLKPCDGCERRAVLLNSLVEFQIPEQKSRKRIRSG